MIQLSTPLAEVLENATAESSLETLIETFSDELHELDKLIGCLEEKIPSVALVNHLKSLTSHSKLSEPLRGKQRGLRVREVLSVFAWVELWLRDPRVRALDLRLAPEFAGIYEEACLLVKGLNYIPEADGVTRRTIQVTDHAR